MRKLLQPGLIALLVVTALAAVPALASDWRPGGRSTIEQSSGNQSDPTAQSRIQQAWGIEARGQSGGAVGSDEGSNGGSPSGGPDTGRASGYQAERYFDPGRGLRVVGLTDDQRLVTFRSGSPSRVTNVGRIFGLKGDRSLVGIDYRVQDGKLYGVGDQSGVYTINTRNASVIKVSQLTVALNGRFFGVDFNPAANRLRVISDTGQNLRHNIDDPAGMPAAGTTATDAMLTYPPATGVATGVTGAGYTNNDVSSGTATTLFDIDTNLDQTAVQSPANAGTSPRRASCWSTATPTPASTSTAACATARPCPTPVSPRSRSTDATACTRSGCSPAAPSSPARSHPGTRSSTSPSA